jgi:diguanylate cyclase (GGDEF)-like protein
MQTAAPIARLRAEFVNAATETDFLLAQAGPMLRHLRRALLLCVLFYVPFGVNDVAMLGWPAAWLALSARAALPVLALLALWQAHRPGAGPRAVFHGASLFTAGWLASFLVIAACRPHDVLLHGMGMAVMAMVVHVFLPNRSLHALAIALAGSLGLIVLAWHQDVETPRRLVTMTMLILVANAFGAICANRHASLWREQYWTQQVLTNLSIRDPLTGCFNRRHLNASLLDGEIARARRYCQSLALFMCDLDGFKAINDTHGHHAGDELLRRFAAVLHGLTRESVDTVVRYGGEEFLVILPETDLAGAADLAERLRAAFAAERVPCRGELLSATASFGVAAIDFAQHVPHHAATAQALIAAADALMYEAKRGGRNQVRSRAMHSGFGQAA